MISYSPIIQNIKSETNCQLDVLRLDLLHEEISGNKWFKLKRNLEKAKAENFKTILSFGGAFSNHIAATAAACREYQFKSIGIIRGDESQSLNPTLKKANENGMLLHFVSRDVYSKKDDEDFKESLTKKFGDCYIIPEGGNNEVGLLGCREILKPEWNHDYIFCACGTGTTYGGLLTSKTSEQTIIGISALKGDNSLPSEVLKLVKSSPVNSLYTISGNEALEKKYLHEDCILNTYAFKGYAKFDRHLVDFKNKFEIENKFELDHVYTTKLFFAVFDLLKQKKLRAESKLLVIHSGGLQGNKGFEERYHLTPSL